MPVYLIHQQSGQVLTIGDDPMIMSREWISRLGRSKGVKDIHARVLEDDNIYYLQVNDGETMLNALAVSEPKTVLNHNDVILLGNKRGGAYFIFKNDQQHRRRDDTRKMKLLSLNKTKNVAEQMTKEFFAECPVSSLPAFARYLMEFMVKKFRIHRGVLYRIAGKKWISVIALSTTSAFVPPRSILDRVWSHKKPERFSMTEVEDTQELTKSIVSNRVYSAICFPILHKDKLIAVIYVDTQEERVQLSKDDLMILCTLIPAVGGILRVLLGYDTVIRDSIKLISANCVSEYTKGFDYFLLNTAFENGFSCVKAAGNSAFCCFVKIETGKTLTVSEWVAYYIKCLTAIRQVEATYGQSEVFLRLFDWLLDEHPDLYFHVGILEVSGTSVQFSGLGAVTLVVKPPDEVRKAAYIMDVGSATEPFVTIYEQECPPSTKFVISGHAPEAVCKVLDSMEDLDDISKGLRALSGGFLGVMRGVNADG